MGNFPPVTPRPLAASQVAIGGEAVIVAYGPIDGGGLIYNPATSVEQGIPEAEALFVNVTGANAALAETITTYAIQPGETYRIKSGLTTNVSVNAATSHHQFAGVVWQPSTQYPPTPQTGTFPPAGPTTLTAIIPSYVYQQYADDDNIQAFCAAFNGMAQSYASWFATIGLPVYTGSLITESLLDWVGQGIYGIQRPSLSSGANRNIGPLNTYTANSWPPLNTIVVIGPNNVVVATDDVYKRVITWNFYKGDGRTFTPQWLKRRIKRFLIGVNGTAPNVDETYDISVTFSSSGVVTIKIAIGTRSIIGGAMCNRFGCNQMVPLNTLETEYFSGPSPYPLEPVLQEAINLGLLQLPFQFSYNVIIN